jgi:lipid-A-disaccharide synthase
LSAPTTNLEPVNESPSLLVSVGDLSADKHTAKLLTKLKELKPGLKIWGLGSAAMRESGVEILFDAKDFSSIGIISIFRLFPFFIKARRTLFAEIKARRPKAVLLVDFGGFNLGFATELKKRFKDLPIYYFISPQIWGSRPWRINVLAKCASKVFVIFPFERTLYAQRNIPVRFVGHPLTKNLPSPSSLISREEFCKKYNLDPQKPIIAIFAGSRKSEITSLLPVLLQAFNWLSELRDDIQFAFSQANEDIGKTLNQALAANQSKKHRNNSPRIIFSSDNYSLMSICDLVWAKSGTTTLEATLFGKPMLIFYRGDWLSYLIFLAFKRVKRVGWPNLLAGKNLVPELIQLDCRAQQIVKYSLDLIDVPKLRDEIAQELLSLRDQLGEGDYASDCASELAQVLEEKEIIAKIEEPSV